jgi:PHD/YefM family antitoxin component YafN of YafNO toxin-antitoxin module
MTTTTDIAIAEHTLSLAQFRDAATETLDRVNRTGEPEAITVDGEVRAMLVPPVVYEELLRDAEEQRYAAVMRRAIREHEEGKSRPAEEFFDELRAKLRAKLLAMRAAQEAGAAK